MVFVVFWDDLYFPIFLCPEELSISADFTALEKAERHLYHPPDRESTCLQRCRATWGLGSPSNRDKRTQRFLDCSSCHSLTLHSLWLYLALWYNLVPKKMRETKRLILHCHPKECGVFATIREALLTFMTSRIASFLSKTYWVDGGLQGVPHYALCGKLGLTHFQLL